MPRGKAKKQKRRQGRPTRGRGPRGQPVQKVKLGAGTLRHKASRRLAAGSGRARREHVQRRRRGHGAGAGGREAAGSQGPRLPPPRPAGRQDPRASQLEEKAREALKSRVVNLVQSRQHRTHLKRGSRNSCCVQRLALDFGGHLSKCIFSCNSGTGARSAAAAAVIHY